jgi:hypothetical protein
VTVESANSFSPAWFQGLAVADCPFANLPELTGGRWAQGLNAEKMAECRWLRPLPVGEFEYVEWMPDNHLRHVHFVGCGRTRRRATWSASGETSWAGF